MYRKLFLIVLAIVLAMTVCLNAQGTATYTKKLLVSDSVSTNSLMLKLNATDTDTTIPISLNDLFPVLGQTLTMGSDSGKAAGVLTLAFYPEDTDTGNCVYVLESGMWADSTGTSMWVQSDSLQSAGRTAATVVYWQPRVLVNFPYVRLKVMRHAGCVLATAGMTHAAVNVTAYWRKQK